VTLPLISLQNVPLTNRAYGYPQGAVRRVDPIALACLHITANSSNPPATARQERDYANRANSGGPSAHLYVDPKGGGVWAIDPAKYAAWSNGDVRSPRTAVPGVQAVLDFRSLGYNPNEAYAVAIEQVGRFPDYPITPEQVQTVALVIAEQSIRTGLPIERRTVHLHGDLNTETRRECPVPVQSRETYADDVIRRANEYRLEMLLEAATENYNDLADLFNDMREERDEWQKATNVQTAEAQRLAREVSRLQLEWAAYADEVTSRAGGILGLDRPA
jgi:vacuolar-type H+-ATPase subunit H